MTAYDDVIDFLFVLHTNNVLYAFIMFGMLARSIQKKLELPRDILKYTVFFVLFGSLFYLYNINPEITFTYIYLYLLVRGIGSVMTDVLTRD